MIAGPLPGRPDAQRLRHPGGPHDRLDQVALGGRHLTWRRIWPTPPTNPQYTLFEAWMLSYGHGLLAVSRPAA
ncbi:hypothetical protein GCM10009753_66410 [Streptantibioticus ferralitis]